MPKKDWMVNETELDDDQIRILQSMLDKSCIVEGCAGSGKSVLALIKAQRIQKEKGNDYQIIVYTKSLARFMNAGRKHLGLENQFTYHWDFVHRKLCPHSHYIIVDEIQDFTQEEVEQLVGAGDVFFFYGDSAQSIFEEYKNTINMNTIFEIQDVKTKAPKRWELYRNYRLPVPVAKVAQYVGVDLMPFDECTYKSKVKTMPLIIELNSLEEQVAHIADTLKRNSILDDVGIFAPSNSDVKDIHVQLNQLDVKHEVKYTEKDDNGRFNEVDTLNFNSPLPKVMTYHSAKGLQFGAVFLPNVQPTIGPKQKLLYVAMTRTYNHLYIYYSNEMPTPLSAIPPELYRTSDEAETIEDM